MLFFPIKVTHTASRSLISLHNLCCPTDREYWSWLEFIYFFPDEGRRHRALRTETRKLHACCKASQHSMRKEREILATKLLSFRWTHTYLWNSSPLVFVGRWSSSPPLHVERERPFISFGFRLLQLNMLEEVDVARNFFHRLHFCCQKWSLRSVLVWIKWLWPRFWKFKGTDLCQSLEIVRIAFYPKSKHFTQPFDVAVFKPLKRELR